MKYSGVIVALLMLAVALVSTCLGQIHFSPTWDTGKRSLPDPPSIFAIKHHYNYNDNDNNDNDDESRSISSSSSSSSVGAGNSGIGGRSSGDNAHSSNSISSSRSSGGSSVLGGANRFDDDFLGLFRRHESTAQSCASQLQYDLLMEIATLLAREAKRLSNCMKGCTYH